MYFKVLFIGARLTIIGLTKFFRELLKAFYLTNFQYSKIYQKINWLY